MAFCFAIIPAKAAAEGLSISVTERKEVFGRRSGKHGIRSQAGPLLHGSDRKAGLSHPCPNDSSFLKKTFSHTKADLRVPFLRPEGQTDPPAIRLSTHGGIRTRGNGELNPIEQDLGASLSPFDCPVQAAPGIRFGRASRTAVIPYTRAVGVLQVYFTILWSGIHGKKAANCMNYPSIRL